MGHYVTYMDFPKSATKAQMSKVRADVIEDNGERDGGHLLSHDNGFTLHDGTVYDGWAEAEAAINRFDRGWYDDHGVLYRDYSKVKSTKEMRDIERRIAETRQKKDTFVKEHMPNRVKAEFVGCRQCGSKVARKYLRGTCCPVCRKDIRPQSTIDREKAYDVKIDDLLKKLDAAEKKQKDKAEVRWLVKLEFHV